MAATDPYYYGRQMGEPRPLSTGPPMPPPNVRRPGSAEAAAAKAAQRRQRYRTIRSGDVTLGRIGLAFDYDAGAARLFVHLLAARELHLLQEMDFRCDFHVRLQILPARSMKLIEQSLFNAEAPQTSRLCRTSHRHRATLNPLLDEEFAFDLGEVVREADKLRLFVAVMASVPLAVDETGFAGCCSFPLQLLIQRSRSLPRWYWLHMKRDGLDSFAPVEHEAVDVRSPDLPAHLRTPEVLISGRRRDLPNTLINGIYVCRPEKHNDRHVFVHQTHGLCLYFHQHRRAWAIADAPGHPAPYAFVDDAAEYPGNIQGVWWVFSREREFAGQDGRMRAQRAPGTFEHDLSVRCRPLETPPSQLPTQQSHTGVQRSGVVSAFVQMQLNPALSHMPEPDVILPPAPPRRETSSSNHRMTPASRSRTPGTSSRPLPLPAYRFPPMDDIDEPYED